MTADKCNFCVPESFSDRTISTNEYAIGLLSSPRLAPGHSLVIPRRCVESLSDLSGEEIQAVHELISPIYERLLGAFALGVDVWQKTRHHVKQDGVKMDHIHFHIIPSQLSDERYNGVLRWTRDQFAPLSDTERDEMLEILSDTVA